MGLFYEGDLVQEKQGGPEMSVVCLMEYFPLGGEKTAGVLCVWEVAHFLREDVYPDYALKLVSRAPGR